MEPRHSAQDLLRCHLCETPVPPLYCEICDIHLCSFCGGKHLLDESTEHRLVPFKKRGTTSKCKKHPVKICELYCEQCDSPICSLCIASKEHQSHDSVDIVRSLEDKKTVLQKDLQELEKSIYPKYQELSSNIPVQRANRSKNSEEITMAINKYGNNLHKEIDNIIEKLKSDFNEIYSGDLAQLKKQEDEITHTISEIRESMTDLRKLLNSNDVGLVSAYQCRNAEFRRLFPRIMVFLPRFTPQKINKEQLHQQFGSLSMFTIKTEESGYKSDYPGAELYPLQRPLIDVPRIITEISTEYTHSCSVSCLSDDQIWMCGKDSIIRLYNIKGQLMKSIPTKSGFFPKDITVTGSGDLVYIGKRHGDSTLNMLINSEIQTVIKIPAWIPISVCSTFSGELLVVLVSKCGFGGHESKVVRYSGLTETQCIQYGDDRRPLYSECISNKYITENKNLDICVSDLAAHAVVVVNQAGKMRFIYTGRTSKTEVRIVPKGITTDSQSRILTADCYHRCIHIIDQDGQFLRYIDNCNLYSPGCLCVDNSDNLFVVENHKSNVKKIQYSQNCRSGHPY